MPWKKDSEDTPHTSRNSNSAALFIQISGRQLLTKICQVSVPFNFSPNARKHGSLASQGCVISLLLFFCHLSIRSIVAILTLQRSFFALQRLTLNSTKMYCRVRVRLYVCVCVCLRVRVCVCPCVLGVR